MASTNVWTLQSPALNVEYIMPDGFWVTPNNASNFTVQWNAFKANGSGAAVVNVTLINRDITAGVDRSSLPLSGVNGGTFITSNSHNGVNIFAGAFKITSAPSGLPDHCTLQLQAYAGVPYALERVRRGAAWAGVDGSLSFVWRSGAWVMVPDDETWRGGAWTPT